MVKKQSSNSHRFSAGDVELHSLSWDNYNKDMIRAHRQVTEHFEIPVRYHQETIQHDVWLDKVAHSATANVFGFMEPDTIPLNRRIADAAVEFCLNFHAFVGCAQVPNQSYPPTHIHAAPSFFCMSKACYERLGRPSFRVNARSDAAEEVSYTAERKGHSLQDSLSNSIRG